MDKDLPRSVSDIPGVDLYNRPKIWSILGESKRLTGTLKLYDDHAGVTFDCKRADAKYYKDSKLKSITAKGSDYSRALLIDSTCWESPMTQVFKRDDAKMRLNPSLLIIQGSSEPINKSINYIQGYLPGIAQWFEQNFIEFDNDEYRFLEPKTIYHKISIGTFATITLNAKLTIDREKQIMQGEFYAFTESFVRIDFTEPTSFSGAINIFSHVENFFNFIFSTPHSTNIFSSSNTKKGGRDVLLYIISPYRRKNYERKDKKDGSSMLFSWEDVSNRDAVFINWALDYDNFSEIIDALILLRSTDVSEEMRFTTIINALESVHRRFLDKKPSPDKDFKKRVERILSTIDNEDDKKLVDESLQHKNEMSLRQRLKSISSIGESVGIEKPSKSMVNKILITRNYLTHGDESIRRKILEYSDLYYVNSLLGKYLKVLLLSRIGVTEEDLKSIVKKSPHFQYNFRDEPPRQNNYMF